MGRALEISAGPDGRRYDVARPDPTGPVTVMPWPFTAKEFTVSVEASTLTQLQFENDAALAAALRVAPVRTLHWEFRKT
jgi:hypothetical protein